MKIAERIAKLIAPEEMNLNSQHNTRLREKIIAQRKRIEFLEREVKRLTKNVQMREGK